MRAVGLSDLDLAVRAVMMHPPCDWADQAAGLIEQAHAADMWRKRTGTAHPSGGTGSLYAQAALCRPKLASLRCDQTYCDALSEVLAALKAWRSRVMHIPARRDH